MSVSAHPPPMGRQNKGPAFLTVALVFTITALMFVLLRVYVRIWVKHAFGWDDGIVVLSMVSLQAHPRSLPFDTCSFLQSCRPVSTYLKF